jgi:hypothetical protein
MRISPHLNDVESTEAEHKAFLAELAARRAIALPRKRKQPVKAAHRTASPARAHGH